MYHFIFSTSSGWKYSAHSTYIAKGGRHSRWKALLGHSIDPRHIILEPKSHTAYCFNCKAGSTTWMTLFTKMHAEEKKVKSIVDHPHKY